MNQTTPPASLESLFQDAAAQLAQGTLTAADLESLRAAACSPKQMLRQRLLYLHAITPSIYASLAATVVHEPVEGYRATMDPLQKDPEYKSVHQAICDGWRVVHFPLQMAPFDDKEIDILGYEFILEKLEHFHD